MAPPLPLASRFAFAFVCFFRVLFDGAFARRALDVTDALPPAPAPAADPTPDPKALAAAREDGALALLAALQREARFVDFVQEDLAGASDADIGAVARAVHDGCRGWLKEHATLGPVRTEAEGTQVEVLATDDALKLTGNLSGRGPRRGTLVHRGWRLDKMALPTRAGGDARVLAPAEVELA